MLLTELWSKRIKGVPLRLPIPKAVAWKGSIAVEKHDAIISDPCLEMIESIYSPAAIHPGYPLVKNSCDAHLAAYTGISYDYSEPQPVDRTEEDDTRQSG